MRRWLNGFLIPALMAGVVTAGDRAEGGSTVEQAKEQTMHSHFSADCFNRCWAYIDKADRSPQEVEDMLLLAHASLWHWKQRSDCKPENLAIGYWQVSRVYALAGHGELSRSFGAKSLKAAQENKLGPFSMGYGYEALARAEFLCRDFAKARELLARARGELAGIADKEERGLLEADIASIAKALPVP